MLKYTPVWVALLLGTLLGMVAQSAVSKNGTWIEALCEAGQPGWSCFLGYGVQLAALALLCAASWATILYIWRNLQMKAKLERDTLQIFVEKVSAINQDIFEYLQPMEKRDFVEKMKLAQRRQNIDIIEHHENYKDYRDKKTAQYNEISKKIQKLSALTAVINVSFETEKAIERLMYVVSELFKHEADRIHEVTGNSMLELTAKFVRLEEREIETHQKYIEKMNSAYREFVRHAGQDLRYKTVPVR